MKRPYAIKAFILFGLALGSCSSMRLTIEPERCETPSAGTRKPAPTTFWDTMRNADSRYAGPDAIDPEYRAFAMGIELITNGSLDEAETIYRDLYREGTDPSIRAHSKTIFASLLFSRSKWKELSEMIADDPDKEYESYAVLSNAFAICPKEEYDFRSPESVLRMALSSSGSPLIKVEVNGHKKTFWLDTGAGVGVIASDVAEECGVRPIESVALSADTATSKEIPARPAVVSEVRLGDLSIRNHPVMVLRKEDLEFKVLGLFRVMKIDGIIGWNAIRNIPMTIDYKNKLVTLRQPSRTPGKGGTFFWLGAPIVRLVSESGAELNFSIDTGASATWIHPTIFTKLAVDDAMNSASIVGSAGGVELASAKVLPSLTVFLSGFRLHFERLSTGVSDPATFFKTDGVLGSDIARNGSLEIDFQNGVFSRGIPGDAPTY